MNKGVHVVTNDIDLTNFCPEGSSCGYFNSSQLEIPFFANNYYSLPKSESYLRYVFYRMLKLI